MRYTIPMSESKKAKLLVVDDDESLLDLIEVILETAGFESTVASNAPDALKIIQEEGPNFEGVVLDLNLQDFPGERMIDDIKELAPHLAVFMTSGCLSEEIQERLGGRHVDGIITKPFGSADLIEKVVTGLELRRVRELSSEGA